MFPLLGLGPSPLGTRCQHPEYLGSSGSTERFLAVGEAVARRFWDSLKGLRGRPSEDPGRSLDVFEAEAPDSLFGGTGEDQPGWPRQRWRRLSARERALRGPLGSEDPTRGFENRGFENRGRSDFDDPTIVKSRGRLGGRPEGLPRR